jgi:Ser/Thr protein kinase RdoA (MazF antagonist)
VAVYRELAAVSPAMSPDYLGSERVGTDGALLLLDFVEPSHPWPWSNVGLAGRVLERLARLHVDARSVRRVSCLHTWDYETQLAGEATTTLAALESSRELPHIAVRRALPAARRLVRHLRRLRARMLACASFGRALVHGDVHSENVIVAGPPGKERIVLVDWTRARVGSALEDVSSWTESLGCWEPEVRRRHDSLLQTYLRAHGAAATLDDNFRAAYWLAAASNVLAGALNHHLAVLRSAPPRSRPGEMSALAAAAALRAIRRADVYWR